MKKILLAPSILSANFSILGKEIKNVLDAGADIIHFDVMDNHYVPNLTFGPMVLESIRKFNISCPIDVHIMAKPVDTLIPLFAKAGATFITIHPESTYHLNRTLDLIKDYGCKVGIALNPTSSIDVLDYIIEKLDLILVMSVDPGYPKQKFIFNVVKKISKIKKKIRLSKREIYVSVDGGVKMCHIYSLLKAGTDIFVMGSYIFRNSNYQFVIKKIREKINSFYIKK
ncbi:ribulose-phosphate 3-epimerase [Buchnera aphidicola]|uniref:ribulose-phosphate 3-epimerase n=1 Tax=Buchnera aphidicola TaxID=9 RepID=UPI002093D007|nr:ribulose-phosphate 3-epimerase [Buchnera aphidicola]USS94095.1 ribulose-phosphate 3-epimerase [Buchnera aphidicola (Sipha maydis)]WII23640.1 ribulose-phosphate 3-epimerase [Buchnera aphidicola (Sipha maydis)]